MPTIVTQIEKLENDLKECRKRMDEIDRHLRLKENSVEEGARLREESTQLGTEAESYERELKQLRKENRKTMFVSFAILFLAFVMYSIFLS